MAKPSSRSEGNPLEGSRSFPVDLIDPNPFQPRSAITPDSIADLVDSVRELGVLQPIWVTKRDERFILVAGHRRMAAAKAVGHSEVPCLVMDLPDSDLLRYALVENLQRADLPPLEEAVSIQQLIETQGLDYRKAAEMIGKSKSYVGERLELLTLQADLKEAVASGKISLKKAIELKKVTNDKLRAKLTVKAETGSLEQLRELIREATESPAKKRKLKESWGLLPELREFSQKATGVRLYKDRISFKFSSPKNLHELLIEAAGILAEDPDARFES